MGVYYAISCLCAVVVLIDGMRRPESHWVRADRIRGYWLAGAVVSGLIFLGPVALLVYLIAFVPLFPAGAAPPPPVPPRPEEEPLVRLKRDTPPDRAPAAPPRSHAGRHDHLFRKR